MNDPKMWDLNLTQRVPEMTWWWWWWIFFIPDPNDKKRSRQLMILWSTKNCKKVKVNDYWWERKFDVDHDDSGVLRFNGMTAAWWYDGSKMVEPLVLEENDFYTTDEKGGGSLVPSGDGDYRFFGNPSKYVVNIKNNKWDFHFEMTPWGHLSEPVYKDNSYFKNYGYNIYRIYGMKMKGRLFDEQFCGTAYFQKLMVNAPALPWMWTVVHSSEGHYLDYFQPHVGLTMRKRTDTAPSWLDWYNVRLSRPILFIDGKTKEKHKFKRSSVKWKYNGGLPTFYLEGRSGKKKISIELECYSRAYWRFEQPFFGNRNNVFFYNEYPAKLNKLTVKGEGLDYTEEDMGIVNANCEHSWGWLW